MDTIDPLVVGGISFGGNIIGIILKPYETYRRIFQKGTLWELPFIGLLLGCYFALSSLVKTAAFRPFLLTKQFFVLAAAAGFGYCFVLLLLFVVGKKFGGKSDVRKLAVAWSYTLIPTAVWFWATSLLYVVLPPPRTTSVQGVVFSVLFLVFSATLFFWKGMLVYLTLRFGFKFDLHKIMSIFIIVLPVLGIYSVCMYRLGIYRVPFL